MEFLLDNLTFYVDLLLVLYSRKNSTGAEKNNAFFAKPYFAKKGNHAHCYTLKYTTHYSITTLGMLFVVNFYSPGTIVQESFMASAGFFLSGLTNLCPRVESLN